MLKKLTILLLFLELFFSISLQGQSVVAVHAVVVLTPPYSLSLSDYGSAGSDRMTINLWTTGFEATDVQLRFTIQGNGFKLVTRNSYMPPVINLQPGIPEMLSGIDLSGYFDPSNLDFIGVDKQSYISTNKLPEGYYTFNVDVYNYPRGNKVSGGTVSAFIVLNEPPIINTPENNSKPRANDPQNIVFSWSPRHMGSPNSAFTTEYEIKIVEIWPKGRDPYEAMRTSPAIYENTVQSTSFIYDMMCPLLTPGNEYAFNIRAKAIKGIEQLDLFKNDGYSETFKFTFGDECKPPTGFEAQPVNGGGLEIKWKTGISHTGYNIRYRVKGSDKDWWTDQSMVDNIRIYQLPGNTDIEYEVDAECGTLESQYSAIQYAHTATIEQKPFECKNASPPATITNNNDQPDLASGAEIDAGGFMARITQVVRNSDGSFSGECIVTIPFFNFAKIAHTFENIHVNELGQLYQGKLISKVDTTGKFMAKIDWTKNNKKQIPTYQTDLGPVAADSVIKITGKIDSIFIKDNNLIIISDNGKQIDTIQQNQDKKILVTDDKGNQYVAENGKVEKVGGDGIGGGLAQASTVDDVTKAAAKLPMLYFTPSGMQVFGYDSLKYNELINSYLEANIKSASHRIPWKSVEAGGIDYVNSILPNKSDNFNPASVGFKKESGANIPATATGKDKQLLLSGGMDETPESIDAYYLLKDTSGKEKEVLIGKLNVVAYEKLAVNLRVVPVNGDKTNTAGIQQNLNAIYKQAVAGFNVQVLDNLQVDELKDIEYVEDEGTGVVTTYSSNLKTIINAFTKKNQVDKEAYYIFLVPSTTKKGRSGYMLLNNQWGFIFTNYTTNLSATISHELGHGIFRLHHTFSDKNKYLVNEKPDSNLMAYDGGTTLNKYQWDFIHHPQGGLYWFQSEEEGASYLPDIVYVKRIIESVRCSYASGTTAELDKNGLFIRNYNFANDVKLGDGLIYGNIEVTVNNEGEFKISSLQISESNGKILFSFGNVLSISVSGQNKDKFKDYIMPDNNSEAFKNQLKSDYINVEIEKDASKQLDILETMSLCALQQLNVSQRIKYINLLSVGSIPERKENIIIKLINSTPLAQANDLINSLSDPTLLKKLISGIGDFGGKSNSSRFFNAITELVKKYFDPSTLESNIDLLLDRTILWDNSYLDENPELGIIKNDFTINDDQTVTIIKRLFIGFTYEYTTVGDNVITSTVPVWKTLDAVTYKPFDIIKFVDNSKLGLIEQTDVSDNDIAYVPAIFLKYASEKQFQKDAITGISVTISVLTLASGTGAIIKTASLARKAWIAFEMANAVGNLTLVSTQDYLPESFKDIVDGSNYIMLAVGGIQLGQGVIKTLPAAYSAVKDVSFVTKEIALDFARKIKAQYSELKDYVKQGNKQSQIVWNNWRLIKASYKAKYGKSLEDEVGIVDDAGVTTSSVTGGLESIQIQRTKYWDDWINKCFPSKNWSNTTFTTIGTDYNTFKSNNASLDLEMRAMYQTSNAADQFLPSIIKSGSSVPVKVSAKQGEKFYKIVPKGGNINGPSPYFLSEQEYNLVKANPELLEQKLGLPLSSVNAEYDVFTITSKIDNNILFKSIIAPTKQYANTTPSIIYNTTGGATQSLIINNADVLKWEKSLVPITTIKPNILPK